MKYELVSFSGPTASRATGEWNDCGVYAIATVLNIKYNDAHSLLARFGRRPRKGTSTAILRPALSSHTPVKIWWSYLEKRKRPTVSQFIARLPKQGRFLICAGLHGFAYIDGVLHDTNRPRMRARLHCAYQVEFKK